MEWRRDSSLETENSRDENSCRCVCVAFDVINLPHKEPPYEESITTSNRDYQKSADDVQELIRIVLMWNKEVTDHSNGGWRGIMVTE